MITDTERMILLSQAMILNILAGMSNTIQFDKVSALEMHNGIMLYLNSEKKK